MFPATQKVQETTAKRLTLPDQPRLPIWAESVAGA
jgi:hypothetical protein